MSIYVTCLTNAFKKTTTRLSSGHQLYNCHKLNLKCGLLLYCLYKSKINIQVNLKTKSSEYEFQLLSFPLGFFFDV